MEQDKQIQFRERGNNDRKNEENWERKTRSKSEIQGNNNTFLLENDIDIDNYNRE